MMLEEEVLFSIIIPTRNRAPLLMRCINSILRQTYENWEVIVVDDGSTDRTKDETTSINDPRIRYFFQEHNERSKARNLGISHAKGHYLCFIDDDDYVKESYLLDFYKTYKEKGFPELILRTGYIKEIGSKKFTTTNYDPKKHKNAVNFVLFNMCGVGSLAIPSISLESEQFPERFPHWQDTHLFVRLLMKFKMIQLASNNYVYVIHEGMGSKKATQDYDPIMRAEVNVEAIEDLFEKESYRILEYVPQSTLNYLSAEKYLQYAYAVVKEDLSKGLVLLKKSLSKGIFRRLAKGYSLFFINLIRGLF